MIVHPETLADKGCWISADRIYAFVSSGANGITEVGYHGAQPASLNARMLVHTSGAFRFAVLAKAGEPRQLVLDNFDWSPGALTVRGSSSIGSVRLEITAEGRSLRVSGSDVDGDVHSFAVQLSRASLFTNVHGRRTWQTISVRDGRAKFQVHDEILLDEWMKRGGLYGSDFLIPEPIRRRIFSRQVRSGLALPADLLPEFQNNPMHLYDAEVHLDVGGEGYSVSEDSDVILFTAPLVDGERTVPPFMACFDASSGITMGGACGKDAFATVRTTAAKVRPAVPKISVPGFEHVEEFFSTVPELVESCVVRDYGIPRATPGGYYWIWAWDAMVTALTGLRWGATGLAERTVAFVDANRDGSYIPMRWTHSLEPLDTQPPGALEVLFASLAYSASRERPGGVLSPDNYSRMVKHLETIASQCDHRGLFSNIGFYPDLPLRFGRTEESTVAMESAAFYSFCRVCENCALQVRDEKTSRDARLIMSSLERSFGEVFWDKRRKFLVDAVERKSGLRNLSYPLFSLLFLHYPPGLRLIRPFVAQAADFIGRHLLSSVGMRMLPTWDRNATSETVSNSWYPHWDAYALKLLRRAGRSAESMTWLGSVETALARLGYAPEYLVLNSSLANEPSAWLRHGSASNLNCATGWYQALLEGVLGLEFDPGGLTILPLGLPLEETEVRDVCHLGTRWNVKAKVKGLWLQDLRLDGRIQRGCLKIPWPHHDAGQHEIELLYGGTSPGPHFAELANAEVLDVTTSASGVEVSLNALGQVDLVFSAPATWVLTVDGKHVGAIRSELNGLCSASLPIVGKHSIRISPRK